MNILVVGGAGFIGSHIVDKILKKGDKPIILDNFSTGRDINIPKGVVIYRKDIIDKAINEIFKKEKVDAVCHLAAATVVPRSVKEPINDAMNNIIGMINLLENCVKYGVKKFVFSSTGGALYGDTNVLPTPEDHPTHPISPYGVSKLTGENYLYYYNKIHGLPVTILRYSNVYGPRQDRKGEGGVVAIFIKMIMNNEQPTIFGTGKQTRDFVYVDDIARANMLAIEQNDSKHHVYNIAKGSEDSVNELFEVLLKRFDKKIKPIYETGRKGEIMRSYLDASKAKKELNWEAEYDLGKGLDATIKYFKE